MMLKIRKDQDKEAGTVTYGKMSEMTAGEMTEASLLGKRGGESEPLASQVWVTWEKVRKRT